MVIIVGNLRVIVNNSLLWPLSLPMQNIPYVRQALSVKMR